MVLLKDRWLAPIGCICLAAAILMDRFIVGVAAIDFLAGMLSGMSVVLNFTALYRSGRSMRVQRLEQAGHSSVS